MVQNCKNGLIWSDLVQNASQLSKKVQNGVKWSENSTKSSNMINKILKLFYKMTTVDATAVGVTAVRNNLKF